MKRFALILVTCVMAAGCGANNAKQTTPLPDPLASVPPQELFSRGVEHAKRGDDVRAEQYLSAALERGAPAVKVLPVLIKASISGQRYRSALGHAEALLALGDADWTMQYLIATLRAGTGNEAGARRMLVDLVEEHPKEAAPRYLYASLLVAEGGRFGEARRHLREYLKLDPEGEHSAEARRILRRRGRR